MNFSSNNVELSQMIAENSMAGMKNLMTQKVDLRSKNVCGKIAIFRVQFPHSDFADSNFFLNQTLRFIKVMMLL